jgi:hypothetical protein
VTLATSSLLTFDSAERTFPSYRNIRLAGPAFRAAQRPKQARTARISRHCRINLNYTAAFSARYPRDVATFWHDVPQRRASRSPHSMQYWRAWVLHGLPLLGWLSSRRDRGRDVRSTNRRSLGTDGASILANAERLRAALVFAVRWAGSAVRRRRRVRVDTYWRNSRAATWHCWSGWRWRSAIWVVSQVYLRW